MKRAIEIGVAEYAKKVHGMIALEKAGYRPDVTSPGVWIKAGCKPVAVHWSAQYGAWAIVEAFQEMTA